MTRFFSLFSDSAKELKSIRTITTSGMLMALAVVIRTLAIQITPDIRISFAFLATAIIAMLYGPVVGGLANGAVDVIGFMLDNRTGNGFNPALTLVAALAGVIYGVVLYKRELKVYMIVIARTLVVLICNITLNSLVVYFTYVNAGFWAWITPRIIKNFTQLPIDIIMLCILLPIVVLAYKRVFGARAHSK